MYFKVYLTGWYLEQLPSQVNAFWVEVAHENCVEVVCVYECFPWVWALNKSQAFVFECNRKIS